MSRSGRTRDRLGIRLGVGALIAMAALAFGAVAFGDNLQNDATTTTGLTTITAGDSTTITYRLIANSAPSGDASGCDASASKPVTVTINAPAGVTAPSSLVFTACGTAGAKTATFSAASAGTYSITHSISGGVTGSLFSNQANFTLTVNAPVPTNTAPTLSLPADQTAEATGPTGATVSYSASANDAEDGALTPSCTPASGSVFPLGATQVNCSVTDSGGLTTSGMFNVIVQDTTPPSLDLPADQTAEATGPGGAAVNYSATAMDLVDGAVAVNCTPASGSTFPLGPTAVSCSATDAHGNTASGGFTVTVVDTTPPSLNLPADIAATATSNSAATVTYTASATDLVDGSVSVTCTPASGSSFPVGATTVNCSSTDAHGNTGTGSFTVTVTYVFRGFFQPVDNLPTLNAAKAGSAIPVKFSLSGNQGLSILASGSPASQRIACDSGDPTDAIEQTVTAGSSSLTYDATADQYVYVLKSDKAWAGTCRLLTVQLADGTSHQAQFKFTK